MAGQYRDYSSLVARPLTQTDYTTLGGVIATSANPAQPFAVGDFLARRRDGTTVLLPRATFGVQYQLLGGTIDSGGFVQCVQTTLVTATYASITNTYTIADTTAQIPAATFLATYVPQ